ncbi:hypothetical protein QZH41_011778, partial [Actinostola sp. cb2023]
PCRDFQKPVASTFEAHLNPAFRQSATKYDRHYYRLMGGFRPPGQHTDASRDQSRTHAHIEHSPYLVATPLVGLKADQIPLRGYENDERSSVESEYSQDQENNDVIDDTQKIPTIMVTSGTSSETGTPNGTSRRSSEERSEKRMKKTAVHSSNDIHV